MGEPPIGDGALLVEADRVVAVGPASELRPRVERHHHVEGVLLPGLVDARARLECADVPPSDSGPYPRWRERLVAATSEWDDARVSRSAQRGVHARLRAGITCVGDVVLRGPAVPAASRAGLVGDSWVEIDGVDVSSQDQVLPAIERTLALPAPGRRVGIALPGTQAVGTGVMQALTALAARSGASMQTVVAASREEAKAVTEGTGPLAREARMSGLGFEWLEGGCGLSPLVYADRCGALRERWSVAHATKFRRGEAQLLRARGTASVMSPRATRILGRPRLAETAAAGAGVALCTEAGEGPPDVLAEATTWVEAARKQGLESWPWTEAEAEPESDEEPPERSLEEAAVRIATVDGAAAMGWGDVAGVLAPGRRADFVGVAVDTDPDRVYADLVARGAGRQVLTVLGGVRRARRADPESDWPEHDLREEQP